MNKYFYKITIIVPTYNVELYIQEAIDSIFNQTMPFADIQVIIVDDYSDDKTLEIVNSKYSQYENVEVIRLNQSSGAAGKPRNIGIKHAKGKYIMFLDPDDLFEKDALETLYKEINENKGEISIGSYIQFDHERTYMHPILKRQLRYPMESVRLDGKSYFIKLPPTIWCKIYRTEFIKMNNIGFPEGIACQDAVFMTECFIKAKKISYIPKCVYRYRLRATSITNNLTIKYFEDYSESRKLIIKYYAECKSINYFDWRYEEDVRFILEKLKRWDSADIEYKVKVIKMLEWFILKPQEDERYIKSKIINLIREKVKTKEYIEAIQILESNRDTYFLDTLIEKLKKIFCDKLR